MIINKPSIKIVSRPIKYNEKMTEYYQAVYENNIDRMLRAIGVCRKKDCLSKGEKFFWDWYKASIQEQPENKKHLSVLQHGDSYSYDNCYYTLRDYYQEFGELNKDITLHHDCNRYQIEIVTNRFTSMQWVRHTTKYSNISFLVESTRAVDYSINEPTINTSGEFSEQLFNAIKQTFELYQNLRKNKETKEMAGRILTEYRETRMIGTATKEEWLGVCSKRMASGAQADAEYIANLIKNALEKED
jgi:hypothetical protein